MLTAEDSKKQRLVSYEELFAPIENHIRALKSFFEEQIKAFEPQIQELVKDSVRPAGKMIRPMLVFHGGWTDGSSPSPELVRAAAVVELVHQATLIHDDILDGAHIRHNLPTIAHKYNSHAAVLLGDALFAHALKLASDFPTVAVCRAVSQATRRACAGEIAQSLRHLKTDTSIEEYYRIIELKTAELFRVSCELGARISGHDNEFIEGAAQCGKHLGIAYQIFDDMADLSGSESTIGKTLGTDLTGGKYTLPLLLLREKTEFHLDEWAGNGSSSNTLAAIRKLMDEHHIPEETMQAFEHQLEKAEKAISDFSSIPAAEKLLNVTCFIRHQASKLTCRR